MIDTQAVRNRILQLAVEGKLVPQIADEGTGAELLAEIKKEKTKLIKEGKLKKQKELLPITEDEKPFVATRAWAWCYLNDIAFVTKLAGFEYTKYIAPAITTKGIPLFKGKNIQDSKLVLDFESFIPENVSDELFRSQITDKCLLTPYVGTIGNIAIFNGDFKAHLGSNVGKVELLNKTRIYVSEEYVFYYLKSTYGYQELTKYKKATAQESISIDAIRNVIIPIPPLAEQKRIVAKVEEIFARLDKIDTAQKQYAQDQKSLKAKLLQLAIEGKLVPCDTSKWKQVKLGDVCEVNGGYAFKSEDYTQKGARIIRISDFNENGFIDSNIVRCEYRKEHTPFLLKINDILLCMTGGTVGKSFFVRALPERMLVNQRVAAIRAINVLSNYLNFVINSPSIQSIIEKTKRSTNDNISMKTIKDFPIPLPPLAEQKRIVAKLEELLPLCEEIG